MNGLRGDHRNMALLLDLLDAEIDRLADSEEPDYDLVRDIMLYVTEYPDVVHHPKEDIVYRHLQSLRPEIRTDLERVETDHQYFEESGLKLRNDMEAISTGAETLIARNSSRGSTITWSSFANICIGKRQNCFHSLTSCSSTATGRKSYLRTMRLVTRYSDHGLNASTVGFWPKSRNASCGTVKDIWCDGIR